MEDIDYGDKTCNSDESNPLSDELGRDLKKSNIIYYYTEEEEEEEDEDDGDITEELLVQMGYGETKTKRIIEEEEDYDEDVIITGESSNQIAGSPKHEPPATPIPADNLKSAMKNSDRKEKSAVKERKVTWAEDVDLFNEIRVDTETHTQRQNGRQQQWGENGKNKSGGGSRKKDKERKRGAKGKGKNFTCDGSSSKNVDFHSF